MVSQGFENPVLFHVRYGRIDFVWSLARFSTISIFINPLITLGDTFLPLADLFVSPVTILDISLACCLVCNSLADVLIVRGQDVKQ